MFRWKFGWVGHFWLISADWRKGLFQLIKKLDYLEPLYSLNSFFPFLSSLVLGRCWICWYILNWIICDVGRDCEYNKLVSILIKLCYVFLGHESRDRCHVKSQSWHFPPIRSKYSGLDDQSGTMRWDLFSHMTIRQNTHQLTITISTHILCI